MARTATNHPLFAAVLPALAPVLAMGLALGLAGCKKDAPTDPATATAAAPLPTTAPPAGTTWAETMAVTPEGGYRMGNPNAPIKLVEFGALSCSHCAEFADKGFPTLRDKFVASGRVSYELRLFMLNGLDIPAALLATCGAPEAVLPLSEQFWAWQNTMFDSLKAANEQQVQAAMQNRQFGTVARLGGMDAFFAARGISAAQGAQCLADKAKAEKLVAQTNDASTKFDVTGTPTFLFNGEKADINTWEAVKARIESMGAR